MNEENIDALLMFKQESMYWLTGYDTFGYVFFQTLILDKNGNIVLLTRAPDLRQAKNTSNIVYIRGHFRHYIYNSFYYNFVFSNFLNIILFLNIIYIYII